MIESAVLHPEIPTLGIDAFRYQVTANDTDIRFTSYWFRMLREYALMIRPMLKSHRLTDQQYAALLEIASPGLAAPLTVGGLARRLGVRHNSAVALINRLSSKGLIRRTRSKQDGRSVFLQATGNGKDILTKLMAWDSRHVCALQLGLAQLAKESPECLQPEAA